MVENNKNCKSKQGAVRNTPQMGMAGRSGSCSVRICVYFGKNPIFLGNYHDDENLNG